MRTSDTAAPKTAVAPKSAGGGARRYLAVVLAAGEGVRMRSNRPKVLHEVAGRSLLGHALASVAASGADSIVVVVGPGREDVAAEARAIAPGCEIVVQPERRGTAHAVLTASDAIARDFDDVLVAFGDTPLVLPETLARLRQALAEGVGVVSLGFEAADPTGYGRLLLSEDGRDLVAIREHKDASEAERTGRLCNGGLMAVDGRKALAWLERVRPDNAAREFYLTDLVAIARASGASAGVVVVPESEVMGVNDRLQLSTAESIFQQRRRAEAMKAGVTMIAPETVFLSHDTQIASDVLIEPNVVFGLGVSVESGAVIHAFSHLEGAHIGPGATVGPYARLRPGAKLAAKAKVGNFVEIKNADIGEGAKISHLTYVGDATVGANANLGAGTITCNYDGFRKMRTVIGEGAFVGSNSSLVAPVTIGDGAYVGSGSVITKDVPPDALAVARGKQFMLPDWAKQFRAKAPKKDKS